MGSTKRGHPTDELAQVENGTQPPQSATLNHVAYMPFAHLIPYNSEATRVALLVKDDVQSYHRQFMYIAPEQVPLQAPQDPVDAEVGTTPARSFDGSDTTEFNTDNKACEAAELAKPVWTGYYTFSLAILPRK